MKLKIYTIKDVVVGEHQSLLLFRNDLEAKRAVVDACKKDSNVKERAIDLQLWKLGEYDTTTGAVIDIPNEHILNFIDCLSAEKGAEDDEI